MKHISPLLITLFALCLGVANAWAAETVTYKVSSKTAVTISGTAPTGSSASYSQTYTTISQLTKGNSATLTLSGFAGQKITGIVLSMKSNSSKGSGSFSAKAGSTSIASLSATTFDKWYDNTSYGDTYRSVTVTLTNRDYAIQTGENVVIQIAATLNSLYIQSYTITYESAGSTSSCTQLATPTNLAVKNITSSTADISWDAVPNATKYKVTCIGDDATIEKEVSATSDQLTGLDASSQYLWSVKAIGDGTTYCDSEKSETKDFTTLASSAPCTQLPAPTELSASVTAYNAATLTWNKVDNATKYQITTTPPRVRR